MAVLPSIDPSVATALDDERGPGESLQAASRGGGGRGDRIFEVVAVLSGVFVLAILALIAVFTTKEALPAFQQEGIGFVTSSDWNPSQQHFGALAFIYGTVVVSLIALAISVPVSLGIALFANEAAPRRMRNAISYVIDLLAAIPSVVYGLWGVLVLAPALEPLYDSLESTVGGWPVIGWFFGGDGQASGKSFMTGGIILAIMIIPIITSLSREVVSTVPSAQRQAAMAMGATRWEMIRSAVIPWSRGGIVGSVMLGLGRAM